MVTSTLPGTAPALPAARRAVRRADRVRLRADVSVAAKVLAPYWPLETFIAVNPLGGLEDRPFEQAVRLAGDLFGARGTLDEPTFRTLHAQGRVTDADLLRALRRRCGQALEGTAPTLGDRRLPPAEILLADLLHGAPAPAPQRTVRTVAERLDPQTAAVVDEHASRWCAAFTGEAGWSMPGRERGLYAAWRSLAPHDTSLPRSVRRQLAALPEHPEEAVLDALVALGVVPDEQLTCLQAHLTALPGWAAHLRWRAEHVGDVALVEYLALRLALEQALLHGSDVPSTGPEPLAAPEVETPGRRAARVADVLGVEPAAPSELGAIADVLARLPVADRVLVWLEAYEAHHRDRLLTALAGRPAPRATTGRPASQVVCCIDARSEGLRRRLEEVGDHETLGFAGFFAAAISYQDLAGGAPSSLCPVLVQPRNAVGECPAPGSEAAARRYLGGLRAAAGAEEGFAAAREDLLAPFTLAEVSGWAAGPLAAAKTLLVAPYRRLRETLAQRVAPPPTTVVDVAAGFGLDDRVAVARTALVTMGLTSGFARLVVLCGHGSTTENNPYGSALDCGACGGNRGGANARTAAAVLNDPEVRTALAAGGTPIPADTLFLAAEHETAADRVTVLDRHLVPATHRDEVDRLQADLTVAGDRLAAERCADLPGAPAGELDPRSAAAHVRARGGDWAQVFPEWGLAGNAAFVIGPRSMTRGLDLGRRCFLHSYDPAVDVDGGALETIMTAPLVVAQWISSQYYFSTVDPEVFGAGTKTVHNVVGGVGVLSGGGGDLRLGLPQQSITDGRRLVHEPVRLLTVVQAPLDRIADVVDRNRVLQHLLGNDWVALVARGAEGDTWQRWTAHGWQPWRTEEEEQS